MKNEDGKVDFNQPICLTYRNDQFYSKVLALSITGIIVGINIVLK